jgi:DNA-directed RNA polymerase subunit RPC12/RpoP
MQFACPQCHAEFDLPDIHPGDKVQCPDCGTKFLVEPLQRPPAPSPAPQPPKPAGRRTAITRPMLIGIMIAAAGILAWTRLRPAPEPAGTPRPAPPSHELSVTPPEHLLPAAFLHGAGATLKTAMPVNGAESPDDQGRVWWTQNGGLQLAKGFHLRTHSAFVVLQPGAEPDRMQALFARSGWTYDDLLEMRFQGQALAFTGETETGATGGFGWIAPDPSLAPNQPLLLSFRPADNGRCEIHANSAPPTTIPSAITANAFGAGYARRPQFTGKLAELRVYPPLPPEQQASVRRLLRETWGLPGARGGFVKGFPLDPILLDATLHAGDSGALRLAWADAPSAAAASNTLYAAASPDPAKASLDDLGAPDLTMRLSQSWSLRRLDDTGTPARVCFAFDLTRLPDLAPGGHGFHALLHRAEPSGPFLVVAESSARDGRVVFPPVAAQNGFYTLGVVQGVPTRANPVRFSVNGREASGEVTLPAGGLVDLSFAAPEVFKVRLTEAATGAVWHDGNTAARLRTRPFRTGPIELDAVVEAKPGFIPSRLRLVLNMTSDGSALYPGLAARVMRVDESAQLFPPAEAFRPRHRAIAASPATRDEYRDYPAYRTAESVLPPAPAEGAPAFHSSDYWQLAVPHPSFGTDKEKCARQGVWPYLPFGDLARNDTVVRLDGLLVIDTAGAHRFRVEATLPVQLQVGDAARTNAPGAALEFSCDLPEGLAPFALTTGRRGAEQPAVYVSWCPPGASDFVPLSGAHLLHRAPAAVERAYRAESDPAAWRTGPRAQAGVAVDGLPGNPDGSDVATLVKDHDTYAAACQEWIEAWRTDPRWSGSEQAARMVLLLTRERMAFLRADSSRWGAGGFSVIAGPPLRHAESLRGFVETCLRHPGLRELALETRADLNGFAGIVHARSFFGQGHSGTNDGYNDEHNFLVNVWRAARVWDDPLAHDAARALFDNHFSYMNDSRDGLHSDSVFSFHCANGRHVNMGGYGADWATRVISPFRFGTPWGNTREQLRRLAEYVLAYEWFCYRGRIAFTTNGRHNTHQGGPPQHFLDRLLAMPREAFDPDTWRRMEDMRARRGGEKPLAGNRFFFRHLQMMHRRADYYFDVKMSSPLVGGIETFAGAHPGNLSFGDGVTTILKDGDEYAGLHRYDIPDALWRYRSLPGVTQLSYEWGNHNPWQGLDRYRAGGGSRAGGVSDGEFGNCGFEFVSHGGNATRARKFFAFTDDGMFVLGAGITGGKPAPSPAFSYRTNLNQCDRRGDVRITGPDGATTVIAAAEKERAVTLQLDRPWWITHGGIGYLVLPTGSEVGAGKPGTLEIRAAIRTPSNRLAEEVMKQPNMAAYREQCDALTNANPPRRAEALEIWIDHGAQPADATCSYFVCMRPESAPHAAWLKQPPVEILANTARLQAVRDRRAGLLHALFHEPGELKDAAGQLLAGVDKPAAVMLRGEGANLRAFVQDPIAACTRDLKAMSDRIILTLPGGRTLPLDLPGARDPDDRYRGGIAHGP